MKLDKSNFKAIFLIYTILVICIGFITGVYMGQVSGAIVYQDAFEEQYLIYEESSSEEPFTIQIGTNYYYMVKKNESLT